MNEQDLHVQIDELRALVKRLERESISVDKAIDAERRACADIARKCGALRAEALILKRGDK